MQIDHAQEQCHRHGSCCSVPNEQAYCSEQCRQAAEGSPLRTKADDGCQCGHDDCSADSHSPAENEQ